jgi:hypothetical protein
MAISFSEQAVALPLLDIVADGAGFFRRVPAGDDAHLVAEIRGLGEQRLAEAALVVAIRPEAAARMWPVER